MILLPGSCTSVFVFFFVWAVDTLTYFFTFFITFFARVLLQGHDLGRTAEYTVISFMFWYKIMSLCLAHCLQTFLKPVHLPLHICSFSLCVERWLPKSGYNHKSADRATKLWFNCVYLSKHVILSLPKKKIKTNKHGCESCFGSLWALSNVSESVSSTATP